MSTKRLIVIAAIVVLVGTCCYPLVMNANAEEQGKKDRIIHIIEYDINNREIVKVTDTTTGEVSEKEVRATNGVPDPLIDKIIKRVDSIQILSTISSHGCTCYEYFCVCHCQ